MRALDAERRAGGTDGLLYAESLGVAIAVQLLRGYATPRSAQPRTRSRLPAPQLARVVGHVESNLDRRLSLADLAGVAGVSPSHFKTQFKRTTGLTVHAYVIQRRVERARLMIVRGELPLAQIAIEAGFAHQSHLARCMRRVLGVTPAVLARGAR